MQGLSRSPKTAQALAMRARIVLACADGLSNSEASRRLGVSLPTIGKWRKRFVADRVDGLRDEPRPGAPRKIGDAQVEAVIAKTLEERPPTQDSHWSTRSMAKAVGLNQTAVSRIWRAFGLKPHQVDSWKLSTDHCSSTRSVTSSGCTSTLPMPPWSSRWTRNRRSKPWTAPYRSCR